MNGIRPETMALVVVRLFIAAVVILVPRDYWPVSPALVLAITIFLFGWAALALAAFIVALPRSRQGYVALLAVDLVFACGVAMLGDPLLGLAILPFGALLWRACSGRWSGLITIPVYLTLCLLLWIMARGNGTTWPLVPAGIAVPVAWVILGAALVVAYRRSNLRIASVGALGGESWVDSILDPDQPFSTDFSSWVRSVAELYGGTDCLCLVALTRTGGSMHFFSSLPADRVRAELVGADKWQNGVLDRRLSVLRDRQDSADSATAHCPPQLTHMLALLGQPVVMGRQFMLGHQCGLLIIAHKTGNDAILAQEMKRIDAGFDDLLDRLDRMVEMRRAFLIEAREVARRDLHDGVLQSLAALRMRLLTILQSGDIAGTDIAKDIRNIADIVALEQARLRSMLDAKSDADQPINLVEALRIVVATVALQWEIDIEFSCEEQAIPMHRESVNNVEFLLREIIANASRHSGAKRLRCSLAIRQSDLVISLKDCDHDGDGEGAVDAVMADVGPLASESLQQRLALVNGRAYSEGLQGGTLLAIAIPLVYDDHIHV